ncbi:MAG: TetR/AcrR family transcriptional regulator [Oscillochloridaceae bacterium umkhey_bin13]
MPYPAQTSREQILDAAEALIERIGADHLALATLATALGIKPPSLYRHIASKAELIQSLVTRTYERLFAAYAVALNEAEADPVVQLYQVLRAHRAFAHAHPASYLLAFRTSATEERPDDAALTTLVLPLQARMAALSGEEASLTALRGALALVHGFVLLELHGQLRRGGDLGAAFDAAVLAYLRGWRC